jgi:hypothetical protein
MIRINKGNSANIERLDLVPLSKFNDYYDYPSVGSLRQLDFYNKNGFANKVIRLLGKRKYVKISALRDWVEEVNKRRV